MHKRYYIIDAIAHGHGLPAAREISATALASSVPQVLAAEVGLYLDDSNAFSVRRDPASGVVVVAATAGMAHVAKDVLELRITTANTALALVLARAPLTTREAFKLRNPGKVDSQPNADATMRKVRAHLDAKQNGNWTIFQLLAGADADPDHYEFRPASPVHICVVYAQWVDDEPARAAATTDTPHEGKQEIANGAPPLSRSGHGGEQTSASDDDQDRDDEDDGDEPDDDAPAEHDEDTRNPAQVAPPSTPTWPQGRVLTAECITPPIMGHWGGVCIWLYDVVLDTDSDEVLVLVYAEYAPRGGPHQAEVTLMLVWLDSNGRLTYPMCAVLEPGRLFGQRLNHRTLAIQRAAGVGFTLAPGGTRPLSVFTFRLWQPCDRAAARRQLRVMAVVSKHTERQPILFDATMRTD